MTRFISLSVFGLLFSELAVFLIALIRGMTKTHVVGDKDLLGAIAIFGFLIFSFLMAISFVVILVSIFRKQPIKPPMVWLVFAAILWVPANIALLNI